MVPPAFDDTLIIQYMAVFVKFLKIFLLFFKKHLTKWIECDKIYTLLMSNGTLKRERSQIKKAGKTASVFPGAYFRCFWRVISGTINTQVWRNWQTR